MSYKPNLLDLPNCLILQLLSYLDATSLYLFSKTCLRFDEIIRSHNSLWRYIDARRAPNDRSKITYCTDRGHDDTHTFLVRADNQLETLVAPDYYIRINKFKNLRIVAIENQTIDGGRYSMVTFPEGLHEFSMKKTIVVNSLEFFRNSGEHMKQLRVLILDECNWVTSSAFMPISKYKNLEILSVYKCRSIENSIPYLSLSGQYGFRHLKIFDARLSPLGNTLIRSLYRSQSLLAIYLQNEDISYKLDYFKRKLQIIKGGRTRDYYVEDDEFDLNDSLTNEENGLNYEDPAALDDRGLLDYLSTVSMRNDGGLPESTLYLDPYNDCNCGYEERQRKKRNKSANDKKKSSPGSSNSDDSDDNDDHGGGDPSIREIENKIARLAQIIHRSQVNNTWSRGLFNHNHPRSPSAPTPIINVRNSNGEVYRSLHDSEDNICVMNLANVQGYSRRPRRQANLDADGVSKSRIYNMIADAYVGNAAIQPQNDEEDDFVVKLEEYSRKEKPTSYYHRNRCRQHEGGVSSNNNEHNQERFRHIIDVHINPPNGTGFCLREASTEIRKRLLRTSDEPETKKPKTEDEPEPGPSGLNAFPEEPSDESDLSDLEDQPPYMERPPTPHPDVAVNNPPNDKGDEYRRIYFRDSPIVRIENLDEIRKDNVVPLRRLSLRGYKKITNTTLSYIKDLDLELLDLTYTNVSIDGINNYLVDHPFCRVVHEGFCVCPTNLHF